MLILYQKLLDFTPILQGYPYYTHLSFGKHKGEAITDLAASSEGAGYIKWLLKQGSVDPYLAQACQQALESV